MATTLFSEESWAAQTTPYAPAPNIGQISDKIVTLDAKMKFPIKTIISTREKHY